MTEMRPRWASLTEQQRQIAADLYEHARPLIDAGLGVAEAIEAAADEIYRAPRQTRPGRDEGN